MGTDSSADTLAVKSVSCALGRASLAALGDDAGRWGSYYDHEPVVLAGHLPRAMAQLARRKAGLAGRV